MVLGNLKSEARFLHCGIQFSQAMWWGPFEGALRWVVTIPGFEHGFLSYEVGKILSNSEGCLVTAGHREVYNGLKWPVATEIPVSMNLLSPPCLLVLMVQLECLYLISLLFAHFLTHPFIYFSNTPWGIIILIFFIIFKGIFLLMGILSNSYQHKNTIKYNEILWCMLSHSFVSDSLWLHRLHPTRVFCTCNF